jgi:hypothetical protein
MKCPYCNHTFPLAWARYFKAGLGRHVCPACLKPSRLEFGVRYFLILILVGLVCAAPGGFLFYKWLGPYWALLGVIPSIAVILPLDKMFDERYRKLKGTEQ